MRESEFEQKSYGCSKLNLSISHEGCENFVGCAKFFQPMRNYSHTILTFVGSTKLGSRSLANLHKVPFRP